MKKDRRASRMDRKPAVRGNGSRKLTYSLLAVAVVLLLCSTIGSTRAALTYYSENYTAEITVSQIGVSLLENGDIVTRRDYDGYKWVETKVYLIEKMQKKYNFAPDMGYTLYNSRISVAFVTMLAACALGFPSVARSQESAAGGKGGGPAGG